MNVMNRTLAASAAMLLVAVAAPAWAKLSDA